ncbi:MAG: CocE/NonD family hydrolase [Luteolibacter sp.]|uniref:alpha/beta hydrolase family protein n=1 Tax=Luteolibacter sp. TaxID=1962973 RepID=UPI0032670845
MKLWISCACIVFASIARVAAQTDAYDPLKVADVTITSKIFDVKDAKRDRTLPVRVYLPESEKPAPVVIFSHGLGGSRDNNPYLGNHWAKRGYIVVFVQHPGSDESVWKDSPQAQRMGAMKQAASLENYMRRCEDIPVVIDTLTAWNGDKENPLHDRFDLKHIGMSGHSFGATTTQAVAGQTIAGGRISFFEPRLSAAVMMSPSIPALGDPAKAFASIKIPCLLMTGTLDDSPISDSKAADRLKVFPNLTNAPAWQIVFDKATHMSFGERDLQGNSENGNRYHKAILALTTAFWDAELGDDKAAKAWLNGDGAKSVLVSEDKWELNAMAGSRP